jgi:hypothetical protein
MSDTKFESNTEPQAKLHICIFSLLPFLEKFPLVEKCFGQDG